ncbi:MAG: flippase-like domain-containing protein [Chloroflexi bacterium]|nr:flippase-like domain-containing protein [Chloroflexota bacterium]
MKKINLTPEKKQALLRWLVRLVGILLLLFFLWKLDLNPTKILDDLLHANGWLVGFSVVLGFPLIGLKTWRWQVILRDLGMELSFGTAYRLYSVGLAAGSFTPGQAGDAIKAWYLRDMGYPLGAALVSIVLDRLFDIALLLLLAAGSILFLGTDFAGELPALLVLLGGTAAALLVFSIPTWRTWLIDFTLKLLLRRKAQKQGDSALEAEESQAVQQLRPVNFLPVFGSTLLATALVLFRVWLLALALDMNLTILQVVAVSSLATAVSLIPVSVGGIGTRDVTLVGILAKLGYAAEKAVSLSTLILLLNLVNLVAGYAIWATRPKRD